jgi:murein DD-endopeptidase MepM/ murein hydrolase activator NlpD
VIVFNYLKKEFYRYAHLGKITVSPGDLVMEGDKLGTVGHTGNASRIGHGHHLHFEIHKYLDDQNTNQALLASDLKKRLENLKHTI